MPPQKYIRALCHEHHVEMRFKQLRPGEQEEARQSPTYACPEGGCPVHYNALEGYFIIAPDASETERDMTPRVRCLRDNVPMYLSAVPRRDLRHWRCPQCDTDRTNAEELVS